MSETKPCPFCFSKQQSASSQALPAANEATAPQLHYVTCMDCGARGPVAFKYETSIDLWNGASEEVEHHHV